MGQQAPLLPLHPFYDLPDMIFGLEGFDRFNDQENSQKQQYTADNPYQAEFMPHDDHK